MSENEDDMDLSLDNGLSPIAFHSKLVGLDEAGRGCPFGRIYVAAVILDANFKIGEGIVIKDSKNFNQITKAAHFIMQNCLEYQIGWRDEKRIDEINVTAASMEAFHECLDRFEIIIMDGKYFKAYIDPQGNPIEHQCVIKGDSRCLAVSCASILAKYSRDMYVYELCKKYPELQDRYDLINNVGYPGLKTGKHKLGILNFGLSQFHRLSYKTCDRSKVIPVRSKEEIYREQMEKMLQFTNDD